MRVSARQALSVGTLLVTLCCHSVQAQQVTTAAAKPAVAIDTSPYTTKLAEAIDQRGAVVDYQSHDLGGMHNDDVTLSAVTVQIPGQKAQTIKGFMLSIHDLHNEETTNGSRYLDLDEAVSLSKAIPVIIDSAKKSQGKEVSYRELSFTTNAMVTVGFRQNGKDIRAFARVGPSGSPHCDMNTDSDLLSLNSLLDKGIQYLNQPPPQGQ